MNELTIVLPAYNEEESLQTLTENWLQYGDDLLKQFGLLLKIVVVNDGSTDQTAKIGKALSQKHPCVTLVNHPQNKGLGEAVKTGIDYVLEHCPQSAFACLMDCDNTHDPKYIFSMLKKQKEAGADVVIASRYQKGAAVKGVSKFRLLTSEGAKYVYSAILRVKNVKDYTCGYRLYNRNILEKAKNRFKDQLIEESGFTCMAELLYKLSVCGAKFSEVPFQLRYDFKKGASKMNVMKTAFNSIALAFRLKTIKPM